MSNETIRYNGTVHLTKVNGRRKQIVRKNAPTQYMMKTLSNILGRQSVMGCLPAYIGLYSTDKENVDSSMYVIGSDWTLLSTENVPVVSNINGDGDGVVLTCQLSPAVIRQTLISDTDKMYLLMVSSDTKYALAYVPIDYNTVSNIATNGATFDVKWEVRFTNEQVVIE